MRAGRLARWGSEGDCCGAGRTLEGRRTVDGADEVGGMGW
jgi:hypothetical protein